MISALPSKQILLAMLASQLYSPLKDLAIGLDLVSKQKENN